jgi:hypothetical protein
MGSRETTGGRDGGWPFEGWGAAGQGVANLWRDFLSTQVSFVRDMWGVADKLRTDPPAWPGTVTDFWARWGNPSAWVSPSPHAGAGPAPASVFLVIDEAAEATAEREVVLPARLPTNTSLQSTPLRNVLAGGELPAAHVEARLDRGGASARVALVNLLPVHQALAAGALAPGLYVGAIVAEDQPATPLALVQALLDPRRATR